MVIFMTPEGIWKDGEGYVDYDIRITFSVPGNMYSFSMTSDCAQDINIDQFIKDVKFLMSKLGFFNMKIKYPMMELLFEEMKKINPFHSFNLKIEDYDIVDDA